MAAAGGDLASHRTATKDPIMSHDAPAIRFIRRSNGPDTNTGLTPAVTRALHPAGA
jgi:hypothetical protein